MYWFYHDTAASVHLTFAAERSLDFVLISLMWQEEEGQLPPGSGGPVTEQKTLMLATLWKKFRSGLSGSQSWYEAEADSTPGSSQSSPPSFLLLLCENHVTLSDLGACLREQTCLSFPKRILHFYNL